MDFVVAVLLDALLEVVVLTHDFAQLLLHFGLLLEFLIHILMENFNHLSTSLAGF